jgi:hypothetical protein
VIDGDTIVMLTKKQADNINQTFESQKAKIKKLKLERDSLLQSKKPISVKDSIYYSTLAEDDLIKNSLYWNYDLQYDRGRKTLIKVIK